MNLTSPEPFTITAITVVAGVVGVVLSAFLKPVFEDWFQRRRKTIRITTGEPTRIKTPSEHITLEWQGHRFTELQNINFLLRNMTQRTLRNFSIEFFVDDKPSDQDFTYITLEPNLNSRFTGPEVQGTSFTFSFQYLEAQVGLKGYLLSSYARAMRATTMDDLEIRLTTGVRVRFWLDLVNKFVAGLAAAALALSLTRIIGF